MELTESIILYLLLETNIRLKSKVNQVNKPTFKLFQENVNFINGI